MGYYLGILCLFDFEVFQDVRYCFWLWFKFLEVLFDVGYFGGIDIGSLEM